MGLRTGLPLGIRLNVLLQEDRDSRKFGFGKLRVGVSRFQLDTRAEIVFVGCRRDLIAVFDSHHRMSRGVVHVTLIGLDVTGRNSNRTAGLIERRLDQRNLLGRYNAGLADHADFARNHNVSGVLVGGNEIRVLSEGRHLGGMDEKNLVRDLFLAKSVHHINNALVLDSRCTVARGLHRAERRCEHVRINLARNSLCKLGFCLPNGITVTGVNSFLRQTNGLHGLLDRESLAGSAHLGQVNFRTLRNVHGITDISPLRDSLSVTGHTLKGSVHLCIRRNLQHSFNLRADHIAHNFRINHLVHLRHNARHNSIILSLLLHMLPDFPHKFSFSPHKAS